MGNLIGPAGARLADVGFMLFGWPAYLFPVAIAFSAWVGLMRAPGEPGQSRSTVALRTIGIVLVLATSCGLATIHYPGSPLPAGAPLVIFGLLLIAAAMLVQTIRQLDRFDLGLHTEQVLTARIGLLADRYADAAAQQRYIDELLRALRAEPGVVGAAALARDL